MKEIFIKKYWDEENILYYLHFVNGEAIRQIEITPITKLLLTMDNPIKGNSLLYDQSLDELELKDSDFITEEDFNNIWNEK